MCNEFISRGYNVVSNGTDNHLMLIDLRNKNITGKDAESALVKADITANKNMVPYDDKSPFITSGIRFGTPAITTRGFKESETIQLTHWMADILDSLEKGSSETVIPEVKEKVLDICSRYPVYQ